jgi:hypothetical protein
MTKALRQQTKHLRLRWAEHRPALRPVLERTGCWQYLSG